MTDSTRSALSGCPDDAKLSLPGSAIPTDETRLSADRKDVGSRLATSGDVIVVDRKCGVANVEAGCTSSGNDVCPVSMSPTLATYIGVLSGHHIASFPLPVRDRK